MPMDAWTLASTSRETVPLAVIGIPAFMGHWMFMLNRFVSIERSIAIGFGEMESSNEPIPHRAAKVEYTRKVKWGSVHRLVPMKQRERGLTDNSVYWN